MRRDISTRRRRRARLARFAVAPATAAAIAVVVVMAGSPQARAQGVSPTTTTNPASSKSSTTTGSGSTNSTGTGSRSASTTPTGQVAYITSDGRVLIGEGSATPIEVGTDAAIGRGDQGSVSVSPNADAVAYVRADGALVTVPIDGGEPKVLATDASTASLGKQPTIAWGATGDALGYVAIGTEAMVPPKPANPPAPSAGSFRVPMPQGVLGNVMKVVDRSGSVLNTVGDPSGRSITGLTASPSDDIVVLDSVIPGTSKPYTLSLASGASPQLSPTPFSADDTAFAPDGRYVVAVGPDKGRDELIRVSTDTLDRATLVSDDDICAPAVSPDGTRIVYAAGRNCSELKLVGATGGRPIDITPPGSKDTTNYGVGGLSWTAEGRFITFANCANDAGTIHCGGPTSFLDPDSGRLIHGPDATTIAPIRRPLIQDIYLDIDFRGPLKFRHSFVLTPDVEGDLTKLDEHSGILTGRLTDGGTILDVKLQAYVGQPFVTGQMTITDPEGGIDRTFMILGRANVVGVRVFSLTGMWLSTDDLPFATGEFNAAVRRR